MAAHRRRSWDARLRDVLPDRLLDVDHDRHQDDRLLYGHRRADCRRRDFHHADGRPDLFPDAVRCLAVWVARLPSNF